MAETYSTRVLIVGAGLSGLMAAGVLQQHGIPFIIAERDERVGGRLATHSMAHGLADEGAQFFTVRADKFRRFVDQWIADGLVYEWSRGWSDGSLKGSAPDGFPRYASKGGMNALAQHLASGLDPTAIRLHSNISTLAPSADGSWQATDDHQNTYRAEGILLTAPMPQSLQLLQENHLVLDPDYLAILESIEYGPCLCGIFQVQGEMDLPEPGALQTPMGEISWMADNQRKGISSASHLITVHAGVEYSRDLWNLPDNDVLATLRAAIESRLRPGAPIHDAYLKRWQYSIPLITMPQGALSAKGLPLLVFAGDAFGGRIEGAALSGLDAGRLLLEGLSGS